MAHRPHIKVNRTFFYSSKAPATAAGGLFAVLQSVGVLGVATSTKVAISALSLERLELSLPPSYRYGPESLKKQNSHVYNLE